MTGVSWRRASEQRAGVAVLGLDHVGPKIEPTEPESVGDGEADSQADRVAG